MPRFDFDSPGAAFVDTMAKVLAERKAEERQTMLDRLTQQAEARASRAEERAVAQQEFDNKWRNTQIEDQIWRRDKDELNMLLQNVDPTVPLDRQNLTPRQIDLIKRSGAYRERPETTAGVSTSESFGAPPGADYSVEGQDSEPWLGDFGGAQSGPAPAPKPATPPAPKMQGYFAGNAEYQARERLKAQHGNLVVGLLSRPETKEKGQYLAQLMQANNGIIPDSALDILQPNIPVLSHDQETDEFTELEGGIDPRARIVNRTRPPRQPVAPRQRLIGTNPEGYPVFERPDGTLFTDNSVQLGGKDTTQNPHRIPQNAMDNLRMAVMGMADPTPEAVANYVFDATNVIEAATTTPNVKRLVRMYVENPEAVEQVAAQMTTNFTPQEIAQFRSLLDLTRARDFKPALIARAKSAKK